MPGHSLTDILAVLDHEALLHAASTLDESIEDRDDAEIVAAIASFPARDVLSALAVGDLRRICQHLGLSEDGKKAALVAQILSVLEGGASGGASRPRTPMPESGHLAESRASLRARAGVIDTAAMLPDLQKLVKDLAEDMLQRVEGDAKLKAPLREAFGQIEKDGRTAQAFETWLEDYVEQAAVAWVLACVFVRFMEDNGLIDECWLAGEGERRKLAEEAHEEYFRQHAHNSDREYFEHVFAEVGQIPAAQDLFARGKTPLWALGPSGDAAMALLKFWREMDPTEGHLLRVFTVEDGDTRFLGDLYQDLSEKARKKYALLQTPVFVEEFILDRTLTPALDEFGLKDLRLIDPTCGSGHFLLGAFTRLFDLWIKEEPNERKAAQNALDGVWGVDINPYAVAIARFRLIVAALQACGIRKLKQAPGWKLHLATGDSLLWGNRPDGAGGRMPVVEHKANLFEVDEVFAVEDPVLVKQILAQGYHVVVGNPPYITVKDSALNQRYRDRFSTCHRQYSLGVPFTQRFWELAIRKDEALSRGGNGKSPAAGHIGMITANSFMKREFGKKLIEEYLPTVDLTHLVDTSGAYIPGHGTPTVLLFGRGRRPVATTARAVLGIKGEPSTPEDPAQGLVWRSITSQIDVAGASDEFTSTADIARATLSIHPWSIGGGGAADLKEQLDQACSETLKERVTLIGFAAVTREDEVYLVGEGTVLRHGLPPAQARAMVAGEDVRDWSIVEPTLAIFPYDPAELTAVSVPSVERFLWPWKRQLSDRSAYGQTQLERGLKWSEYSMLFADRLQTPLSIAFAFVATHNHFVLDRGGKVFKQSAPIIKLPAEATEDDHLALLGLLNSSTACFWMKQVFYPKATTTGDISTEKGRPEANRYEFAGTGLQEFPVPDQDTTAAKNIAGILDDIASRELPRLLPTTILTTWEFSTPAALSGAFSAAEEAHNQKHRRMIALQEELDWEIYKQFGLVDEGAMGEIVAADGFGIAPEDRPFAWDLNFDSDRIPEIARETYRRRRALIDGSQELKLIETPVFKRPWWGRQGVYGSASRTYPEWVADACRGWLLDRLESADYWTDVVLQTTAQLADRAARDAELQQVAEVYRGRADFDMGELVAELIGGAAVPFLPVLRYKATGLRKRAVWEETWAKQRDEDAGKAVGKISVPPKYTSGDFLKQDYWRLRGKLDVPKERWISYPHCSTDGDPTLLVGWAGWNHLQQAEALVDYYDRRKREGWEAERLIPLLAGLDQLLPWIHQWHPDIDPEFGETPGQSYETMLKSDAHELGLTLEQIRSWTPPEGAGRKKKAARTKASKTTRKKTT